MTELLWITAGAAVLTLLQLLPIVVVRTFTPGAAKWGLGNREKPFEGLPAWGDRAIKAHANMLENLPHFVALALVAHTAGRVTPITLMAARAFLGFRVAHYLIYLAGIPGVRTVVFMGGLVAELVIFSQLFG